MGTAHRFRFGVQASTARTQTEWSEQARKIEDLGYSTLFMPDHFVDTDLAPMVALSFAAAATETLRLGMLVLGGVLSFVLYTIGAADHRDLSPLRYTALTAALGWPAILAATLVGTAAGWLSAPSRGDLPRGGVSPPRAAARY